MISNAPNRTSFWAALIVEELVRQDCPVFFVSPGSRSSPLAVAVERNPGANAVVHFDERGLAYAALGFARATGKAGVCITTSGTAVANLFPAVVEADVDRIPIILVTADRPPELRETGSNQTIRQAGIFGDRVRWFFDLPAPTDAIDPSFVLTTIDQLVHRAHGGSGPAHLNCMFREPLAPLETAFEHQSTSSRFDAWMANDRAFTDYPAPCRYVKSGAADRLHAAISAARYPLCVLGRLSEPSYAASVVRWAGRVGAPVLPDVTSGYRLGAQESPMVPHFDLVLADPDFQNRMQPDLILQIGRAPVGKRLLAFLAGASPKEYIVVADGPERIDPAHGVTCRLEIDGPGVEALFDVPDEAPPVAMEWLNGWTSTGGRIGSWLDERFRDAGEDPPSEQGIAHTLSRLVPEDHLFVIASSLPIRHVDSYGSARGYRVQVVVNRGASGIDGTVATAAGASLGSGRRATLLTGDLALLHDLNSLTLAARQGLILVVLNNDGGGIFSYLPIADFPDVFESSFGTPHGLEFEHAAGLFRLSYERPSSLRQFEEAYRRAVQAGGGALIEISTDRTDTRAADQALREDLRRVLEESRNMP